MKIPIWTCAAILTLQPMFGQLQLSALDGLAAKAKESTEITLDAATLQLANGFIAGGKGQDATVAKLLEKVKAIVLRTYEFSKVGQYDPALIRTLRDQLKAQGWVKFVDVNDKEDGETFELYSKTEEGKSKGFAMLAAEPKELTVIYIDGQLSLSELSGLSGQFGIPKIPLPAQGKTKNGKE